MKFRTKPFEINAWLFNGENYDELYGICGWKFVDVRGVKSLIGSGITARVYDDLHDTWVGVKPGQWIILGQKGEFYPCDPEIFESKYEPVEETVVQDGFGVEVERFTDPIRLYDERG